MALQFADRVLQTGTANTTVSFTLTGSVVGYQAFSTLTTGNTTYYAATDGTNWETGIGTLTSPTLLTRTTILQSSNSNTAVTFSGTVTVWVDYPSSKSVNLDANNILSLPNQSLTATLNSGVIAVGGVMNFSDTGIAVSSVASTNSYFQNVIQNTSNGALASAEFIAYNNLGTAATNYATVGINSSGYSGTGSINAAGYGYFLTGSTDLVIGTIGANNLHITTNSQATDAMTINPTNSVAFNGSYGTLGQVLVSGSSTTAPVWTSSPSISAASLTGTALPSNIVSSSLTSVGTLASLNVTGAVNSASHSVTGQYISTVATGTAPFVVASTTQVANLNAATAGSAGSVTNALTMNNGGAGAASGTTYNGSAAQTISYNTIGAPSTTGTNASGTWGINITGSAPAGSLTGSALPSGITGSSLTSVGTLASLNVTGAVNSASHSVTGQYISTQATGTAPFVVASTTPVANLSIGGNAATATTASSVTGGYVSSAVAGTAISVSAATGAVTINNTGVTSAVAGTGISVSGSTGAVTFTNSGVTSIVAGTNVTISGSTGAVTINAATQSATVTASTANSTFYVVGTTSTSGGFTTATVSNTNAVSYNASTGALSAVSHVSSSDERLKKNWVDLAKDFVSKLANVKHGIFERISSGNHEVGVTAQSLKEVLPEAVIEGEDGMLSVNYGAAALVSAIELAKEVKLLRAELAELKSKVSGG